MKGASTVIIIILILMISVALAALTYTFFTKIVTEVTTTTSTAVSQTTTATSSLMKVEAISGNTIYVRNIGTADLTNFSVYLNDSFADIIQPSSIKSGEVGTIYITDFIQQGDIVEVTTGTGIASGKKIVTTDPCKSSDVVLCLRFDETSGTTAYDSSNYGNDGILYNNTIICSNPPTAGCPQWVPGRIGNAIRLDGSYDFIRIADSPSLRNFWSGNHTIEFWLNRNVAGGQFFLKSYDSGSGYVRLTAESATTLNYILYNGSTVNNPPSTVPITNNVWTHYIITHRANPGGTGGTLQWFVNGVAQTPVTYNMLLSGLNPLRYINVGHAESWGSWVNGIIDEIRVYNKTII